MLSETFGKTKPGQSHKVMLSVSFKVWKCLVLPGILATPTFFLPKRALITLDLPTLGYPTNPTYTLWSTAYLWKTSTNWWGDNTYGVLMFLSSYPYILAPSIAVKKQWSILFFKKYSFHLLRIYSYSKSLLLTITKNLDFSNYFA